MRRAVAVSSGGLSPRVRGNRANYDWGNGLIRSIPACAGEPPPIRAGCCRSWVYPRVCGGTRAGFRRQTSKWGLSPRVRGNRYLVAPIAVGIRSIPACAGEPVPSRRTAQPLQVYPRVCGGTDRHFGAVPPLDGLSPRVRGNRPSPNRPPCRPRSIPACAGEPRRTGPHWSHSQVYPRVCGGTALHQIAPLAGRGLSPRVRGNPGTVISADHPGGSIPACAGEPGMRQTFPWAARVYPRVCGGTFQGVADLLTPRGLSPRVRGNREVVPYSWCEGGSIPACAGEPQRKRRRLEGAAVYPRVCGGTRGLGRANCPLLGLSPRVRGNRGLDPAYRNADGSIPACAGEPGGGGGVRLRP